MNISPVLIFGLVLAMYLANSVKILNEYERGVIFRMGKLLARPKGPGIVFVFAPIDRMVRVARQQRQDFERIPGVDTFGRRKIRFSPVLIDCRSVLAGL